MKYRFGKQEHLKSRKTIGKLFQEGKQLKKYPIKLVYLPINFEESIVFKVAFSVPKRNFKRAVDRNHLKRLLREIYRLQKELIATKEKQQYALMFIYLSKEKLTFEELKQKMEQLLIKLKEEIHI